MSDLQDQSVPELGFEIAGYDVDGTFSQVRKTSSFNVVPRNSHQ